MTATPRLALAVALLACTPSERPDSSEAQPAPALESREAIAADAAVPIDAARPAPSLEDALSRLRGAGLAAAADAIAARVAQRAPKMKLSAERGAAAASYLLELAPEGSPLRALHQVMPRSSVELARAVGERGVPRAEAEAIARYLVELVRVMRFERLAVFDDNHSHVTGREWHEIDYSGEGMTWRRQRAYWKPRGVPDFERAAHIHAYFVGAAKMKHFERVYRPRGRMEDVAAPE